MIDSRKIVDIPLPQFSLILKKTHLIKASFTWLVYISLCFLLFLFFPEISSTCNSPRLHLSVIIFLIPLLPSSSVKMSFSNTLLISETKIPFHYTTKISIALCWPISRDTKSMLTWFTSGFKHWKLFSRKNFPAITRVWSRIYYGEESTSSHTFNYFFCLFSGKSFSLFN